MSPSDDSDQPSEPSTSSTNLGEDSRQEGVLIEEEMFLNDPGRMMQQKEDLCVNALTEPLKVNTTVNFARLLTYYFIFF